MFMRPLQLIKILLLSLATIEDSYRPFFNHALWYSSVIDFSDVNFLTSLRVNLLP